MLAEKSIIKFKTRYKGIQVGIITDVWSDSYSVCPGVRIPKLNIDESSSPWFFNVKPEDILEVIKDASPKPKKAKVEEVPTEAEAEE